MTVYFQGTEREDFIITAINDAVNFTDGNFFNGANVRVGTWVYADPAKYLTTTSFSATDLWTHFVYRWDATSNALPDYTVAFYEGATPRYAIRFDLTAQKVDFRYYNGSAWVTLVSSTSNAIQLHNIRRTFDVRIKIGGVGVGECRMYLEGTPIASSNTFDFTMGGACSALTSCRMNGGSAIVYGGMCYSEVILADYSTLGSRMISFTPNAVGNYNQWNGAGYTAVDEPSPSGDYMTTNTVNQRFSTGFSNTSALSTGETIVSVKMGGAFTKDLSGPQSVNYFVRIGTTDYDGADQTAPSLTNATTNITEIWTLNPATSNVWTVSDLNAAEFGVRSRT